MECVSRDPSQSLTKDYFPWYLLSRELQVKILRNLSRRDVDSCRQLNRDMLELIRCNERWMKRRFIENVEIRTMCDSTIYLDVYCHEEGIKKTVHVGKAPTLWPLREHIITSGRCQLSSIAFSMKLEYCLRKIFRSADVRSLSFREEYITDGILRTVSLCLQYTGSKISNLWMTKIPQYHVTSAALLQLLRVADPQEIHIDGFLPWDDFTADLFQFIVKIPFISVNCSEGSLIPIDDDILANLTASYFYIHAPNLITNDGMRSFVKNLASRKQKVEHGWILSNYSLWRSIPTPADANFKVSTGMDCIEITGENYYTEKRNKKKKKKKNKNERKMKRT